MRKHNFTQIYGILGKILYGCSGGIVGFLVGGLGFALIGTAIGFVLGHYLERLMGKPCSANE